MTEAEADALKIMSKTTENVEYPMKMEIIEGEINMREGALGGEIILTYLVAEVEKGNTKKAAKKYDRGGSGCTQYFIKKTEVAEAPMAK